MYSYDNQLSTANSNNSENKMSAVIDDAYSFLYSSNNETKKSSQEEKKTGFENYQFNISSYNTDNKLEKNPIFENYTFDINSYSNDQDKKSSLNDSYYYDYKLSSATLETSNHNVHEYSSNQSKLLLLKLKLMESNI